MVEILRYWKGSNKYLASKSIKKIKGRSWEMMYEGEMKYNVNVKGKKVGINAVT